MLWPFPFPSPPYLDRQVGKKELLQQKSEKMWDCNIMQMLWKLLLEHCYTDLGDEQENGTMDYAVYDKVRTQLIREWNGKLLETEGNPIGVEPFLTSCSFFRLPKGQCPPALTTRLIRADGGTTDIRSSCPGHPFSLDQAVCIGVSWKCWAPPYMLAP